MGGHSKTRVEINVVYHKDKHICDICVSSLWGNVCVEDDLVGKKSFPDKEKHTSDTSDNSFYCLHYCAPPLG